MTKSRVCAERTINFAKQSCAKKTNLLVYEKQKENEHKPEPGIYMPPICNPQVKRIKICTGAELKKICAPPPCPCPPRPPPVGLLTRLARLLGFGVKSALGLAVVYVTYDMGIWGDSQTTADLYKNICLSILPKFIEPPVKEKHLSKPCQAELELFSMQEKDEYCCDKFPIDHESGMYELQQRWNKIVSNTFSSIVGFPETVGKWSLQLYCQLLAPPEEETCKALTPGPDEEEGICTCPD